MATNGSSGSTAAVGNTSSGSTPGSTPYNPSNPFPYYAGQLGSYDPGQYPGVQNLQKEIDDTNRQYTNSQGGASTMSNPFGYIGNLMGNTGAQYNSRMGILSGLLGTQAGLASGRQSAISGATTATAPSSQLGFLTSPVSGQPTYGNGSIGGLAGLSYQAGKINNAGALAGQGQDQAISINNARNSTTQLGNLLKTSNLNQDQLAASNWFGNVVAQNLSNPTLAPIQNAITSAVAGYAKAKGIDPAALTNSLLMQSGGQSIMSVLNNLDMDAYNNYTNTGNVATGGGVSAPTTNLGTATNTTSGVTQGGNKFVITP